jgi:hypothetical protein
MHTSIPPTKLPTLPPPAIIQDVIDKFKTPPIPVTANRPACSHHVRYPQAQPITRSQLRKQRMHMINSAVSNALMPKPALATATTPLAIGYTFAVHQLVLRKLTTNHFLGAIIDNDLGNVLEYRHLVKNPATKFVRETSFANKIGCLVQGIQNLKGTDTCFFIKKMLIPNNKRPAYGRIICNFCPQKKELTCTLLTVGGNRIDYSRNKSTPTTDLTTAKPLINSSINMPKAVFLGTNLANFYLNTPFYQTTSTCNYAWASSQRK